MSIEDIELWNHMPWAYLPESFKVDLSLFLLDLKPSVRLLTRINFCTETFQKVMKPYHVSFANDGFYLAKVKSELSRLVFSDNKPTSHESELGRLLGYPPCCCKKIEIVGESQIDAYEKQFTKTIEKRTLLDISHYKRGIALLSHIPCSSGCKASLKMARSFLCLIESTNNKKNPFSLWKKRLLTYYHTALTIR